MTSAEDQAAAAAGARDADATMVPGTPQEPRSPTGNAGTGNSPVAGASGPSTEAAVPTVAELMILMKSMMETMVHDRDGRTPAKDKEHLANAKLDEKYFRNVAKYSNMKSGWKEWRR